MSRGGTGGVALVLGAGGPVGHAFHAGILSALVEVTGWDPRRATLVVGTSAGAEVAALLRAGLSAAGLAARVSGGPLSEADARPARLYHRPDHGPPPYHLVWPLVRGLPARLTNRLMARRPGPWLETLLPLGRVDLAGQAAAFDNMFPAGWPSRRLWLVAGCLDDGRRVVFGRRDAPTVGVGQAVAASGAVPGINPPVEIDGRLYIDGGLGSVTNLDALLEADDGPLPEHVIVSAPLAISPGGARTWLRPVRRAFGRRLAAEAAAVRARGVAVHLIHPQSEALASMGGNPLSVRRVDQVVRAARQATRIALSLPRDQPGSLASLRALLAS